MASRTPEDAFGGALVIMGALTGFAVAWGGRSLLRRRGARDAGESARQDAREALHAYLRDHLSGADSALTVVHRLKTAHAGTRTGRLFTSLHDEFIAERTIVTTLLEQVGGSSWSVKRALAQAAGGVLQTGAGGRPGELSLFRTLEALAVAVQGKRCLWRALRKADPPLSEPASRSFAELEAQAVEQWARIEDCRLNLVTSTFGRRR